MTSPARSRQVPTHTHITRDIKALGFCPACDDYHERQSATSKQIDDALLASLSEHRAKDSLRLLSMLRRVNPERHAEYTQYLGEGMELADAVDEAMAAVAAEAGLE